MNTYYYQYQNNKSINKLLDIKLHENHSIIYTIKAFSFDEAVYKHLRKLNNMTYKPVFVNL